MAVLAPTTLYYLNLSKRNGKIAGYDIVLNRKAVNSGEYIIDNLKQVQIKNFGQAPLISKAEVILETELDSQDTFTGCTVIPVSPTYINGTIVRANRAGVYNIPIENIIMIEPLWKRPFQASPSVIWVLTDGLQSAQPISYRVDYSVYDLWFYIKYCHFPNPYYYEDIALGGLTFLEL